MSEPLKVDLDRLTLGDLADIEDAGGDISNLQSTKTILALMWITKRQSDPTFTLAAARQISVRELQAGIEVVGGATDPKGNGNSATSPGSAASTE